MVNPRSFLIRFRLWLSALLDPWPDQGEAWCISCDLNGRRTLILSASGFEEHLRAHRETGEPSYVRARTSSRAVEQESP